MIIIIHCTLYHPFFVVLSFECRVGNDFRMMNRILPGFFRGSFCILFCLSNRSSSYNIMYFYNNFIIDSTLGLSTIQSIGLIHHIFLKNGRQLIKCSATILCSVEYCEKGQVIFRKYSWVFKQIGSSNEPIVVGISGLRDNYLDSGGNQNNR